jgi:predicted transport protein
VSDIKLFYIGEGGARELAGTSVAVEKTLQTLIEHHLSTLLGVKFLASEYPTGKAHGGRIDTLGIDENHAPVIIEYKRAINENVINQGLFYLDWLLDHKAEFKLMVMECLGRGEADAIDWKFPRLLCIAADFTKYDEYAVQQINRNVELIRYRRYGDELLLELVNATTAEPIDDGETTRVHQTNKVGGKGIEKTATHLLEQSPPDLRDRFEALKAFLLALGDDVQFKPLRDYFAFRRIKNFACVEAHPQAQKILLFVKVDPDTVMLEPGFMRDVRKIGHFGTGDLEITIRTDGDLERAKPFVLQSYEAN